MNRDKNLPLTETVYYVLLALYEPAPEEAAKRLKGITCGRRNTSCPDQLAVALEQFLAEQ